MNITSEQFVKILSTNARANEWFPYVNSMLGKYHIDTLNRCAGFFAQTGHESSDYTAVRENMNYSWEVLRRVFPRYFPTIAIAKQYERNPEAIANRVYDDANRVSKLGNIYPGDGWKFRGAGLIQLTGRNNFERFGKTLGITAEEAVDYVTTKQGSVEAACWFWKVNNINNFADRDDIYGMTRAINGGEHGLEDRKIRYARVKQILNTELPDEVADELVLKRGSKGTKVKRAQTALKITADGDFGPNTERAVNQWLRMYKYKETGFLTEKQYKQLTKG